MNLTGWAGGLVQAGAGVTVFQRYPQPATLKRDGVTYHFMPDRYGPRLGGGQQPWDLHRQVRAECLARLKDNRPVAVHFNGLLFPIHVRWLRWGLPRRCPLIVQHHAERPWPPSTRRVQRWGLRAADGFFFTNVELAGEWLAQGGLPSLDNVFEIMETSSSFAYRERTTARAVTGLAGEPVILWTGSLSRRKDPLTVLAGLKTVMKDKPEARLYMAYLEDDLLPQVKQCLDDSDSLRERVTLLGRIPHADIEAYYNSADIFVQGSHSEGSGIAVLDALACGVVPVITDIPPFRTLTGNGQIGALWPVGDATAFAGALQTVLAHPLAQQSQAARQFFKKNWRFEVIGRRALAAYTQVWQNRG